MPATTVTIKQKKPVTLSVLSGTTLLDAVRTAGISLDSPCSGNGTCGKCRIRILEGETQTGKLDALKPEDAAKAPCPAITPWLAPRSLLPPTRMTSINSLPPVIDELKM